MGTWGGSLAEQGALSGGLLWVALWHTRSGRVLVLPPCTAHPGKPPHRDLLHSGLHSATAEQVVKAWPPGFPNLQQFGEECSKGISV